MIKNKIVIGLGLALSLTAGVSSATSLGGSPGEVNLHTPYSMDLNGLSEMAPGVYYTITCHLNNMHHSSTLRANVSLGNGSMLPVSVNGKAADRQGINKFEAPLDNDMNTLVLENVHLGTTTATKQVVDVAAHDEPVEPVSKTVWFPRWYQPWGKTLVPQPSRHVDATYKTVTEKTFSDQLTFAAVDNKVNQLGTGYKVEDCDAVVVKGGSADAPAAPVDAAPAAPVAEAPVDATPAADATTADAPVDAAPAPVADAPAADVSPNADALTPA